MALGSMEQAPKVKTSVGCVTGKVTHTKGSTRPVYNYLGIPYALPPVGKYRFLPPKTPAPWEGILDGTKPGLPSAQTLSVTKARFYPVIVPHEETSEDCLYLNIYTPEVSTGDRRPVMFYIHGGGYVIGMGDIYDGTAVVTYGDVVVVTCNYRLGARGFLTTGDDVCPGNIGFFDQVAALKWVNQHISNFGGDPENVTIFGLSAGAVSVQAMVLSTLTNGLFHKAISQSASIVSPNMARSDGKERAFKLGRILGCDADNTKTLLDFLRAVPSRELTEAELKLAVQEGVTFQPSVDGVLLKKSPEEMYSAGDFHRVPHIVGFTNQEGLFLIMTRCAKAVQDTFSDEDAFSFLENFFGRFFPVRLDEVLDATKTKYFPGNDKMKRRDRHYLIGQLSQAVGDMFLIAPTYLAGMLHSRCAPTYLYVYTHRPSYSTYPDTIPGATHGDDQSLVWGDPFLESSMIQKPDPYTEEEERLSKDLIQYFTNFARTGDPNGTNLVGWQQFETTTQTYLDIDTSLTVRDHPSSDIMEFWNRKIKNLIHSSS